MKPVSLLNPPSAAETKKIYEEDKGRCSDWRKHIVNLTASVETPQFSPPRRACWHQAGGSSGVFRAQSGSPLTVTPASTARCRASRRRRSGRTR
jgi:hypothetical protein